MSTIQLPARQAKFVDEYLVDGNGTQAAIRAGYSASGARVAAHRLLTNVAISSLLETRRQADATRLAVTRESVLKQLQDAYELAREKREPAAMVAAARELGKMLGFYAPVQAKVTVDAAAMAHKGRLEAMTDAELFALMARAQDGAVLVP